MKIFFDSEFTGLRRHGQLISLGMVSEGGAEFYAEFNDYSKVHIAEWIKENVLNHLLFNPNAPTVIPEFDPLNYAMRGNVSQVKEKLERWLDQFTRAEMIGDCLAYDWVLFCDIFGGAFHIPRNVYYIPFDLATMLMVAGIDPDINREEFSRTSGNKHNALHDARVIKACYERLRVED